MGGDQLSATRRWVADPLLVLGLLGAVSVAAMVWASTATDLLVLLAAVVAGVSLSGST